MNYFSQIQNPLNLLCEVLCGLQIRILGPEVVVDILQVPHILHLWHACIQHLHIQTHMQAYTHAHDRTHTQTHMHANTDTHTHLNSLFESITFSNIQI